MKAIFQGNLHRTIKGEQGFALLEVMIAAALFAVGLMAVSVMTIKAYEAYDIGKTQTVEVNRAIKNIDTYNATAFENDQIFAQGGKTDSFPIGSDKQNVSCWDFNNVVLNNTKFIAVENSDIGGLTASGNYRLYLVKAERPRVN